MYIPVVTQSTQVTIKLLKQFQSGFKRTINRNKYQPKISTQTQNQYLDCLIDLRFQENNRLPVLSFEGNMVRTRYQGCFLSKIEIKDYNVIIDSRDSFDHPVKNDIRTYEKIRKIVIVQGDDYTTACLLDDTYLKENFKLIAIDLSKQLALDTDPKTKQQINFKANLNVLGI